MKLFLSLLFLFFSLKTTAQKLIYSPNCNKKEINIIKQILEDYVNDEKAVVIYNPYAPLFIGFYGVTYQYGRNICLFSLTAMLGDKDKRMWVLLHEMGHVLDIFYGDLSEYPPMWKDQRMERDLEWGDRPWEQHADEWARRLWRKYFNSDPPLVHIYNEIGHHKDCILKTPPTVE